MGAAASKQTVTKATSAAAKATATQAAVCAPAAAAAATQQPACVVQTTLSREEIVGASAAAKTKRATAADLVRKPQSEPQFNLMEMNDDLLKEMQQFQDFEKIEFLQQDMEGFNKTASSYRPRSSEPISLPTDRTLNASGISGVFDKMEGRLTNRDMRFLLRLHYEDPEKWDTDALAAHFGIDPKILANVLAHVGPPNVLKPLGPSEHPLGIWFDSPAAAAAMVPEFTTPEALPASSTSVPPSSATPAISAP